MRVACVTFADFHSHIKKILKTRFLLFNNICGLNRLRVVWQDADVNARPIVRADCIKFVYTFRNQFSVEQLLALMPVLIAHLRSEHVRPPPPPVYCMFPK